MYRQKTFKFEIEKIDNLKKGEFRGYVSTYDVDFEKERFMPGSFDKDLEEKNIRAVFFMHRTDTIRGKAVLIPDDKGIYVEKGTLYPTAPNENLIEALGDGTIDAMSIGAFVGYTKKNGGVLELYDNRVREVTLVPVNMGANPEALITEAKSREVDFWNFLEKNKNKPGFAEKICSLMGAMTYREILENEIKKLEVQFER